MEPKDLKISRLYRYFQVNPQFDDIVLIYLGYKVLGGYVFSNRLEDKGYIFLNLKTFTQNYWYPQVLEEF